MKKLIIGAFLFTSLVTFAQKDELKTLRKIYSKDKVSDKDLAEYKNASSALNNNASSESDKVYAKFYTTMIPIMEMATNSKASIDEQIKLFNPKFISEYATVIDQTIAFEQKSGSKLYSEDLLLEKQGFINSMLQAANQLNLQNKYKESAEIFYNVYLFDKKNQGSSLNNAAILAVNAGDFVYAEKLYRELLDSDYLNSGMIFYAKSKLSDAGEETPFNSFAERASAIRLGTHEAARDYKMSEKRPETLKIYAIVVSQSGDNAKTKAAYNEALKYMPNDQELKDGLMPIYFNEAYDIIKGEAAIIEKINANRDNPAKYDAYMKERVDLYTKALPAAEKAYELKPTDANVKTLLKAAYEVTGNTQKAASIK